MEYLDIVDENGVPTGETVERGEAHAKGILHRTAHVWLLRKHHGRTEILLQRRCDTKSSFPGCWDISSAGHIPAGVDYAPSAVRELKEELGVDVSEAELIFCTDRRIVCDDAFFGRPYHDRQYTRVFALWCDREEAEFSLQAEEVSAVRWMALEEAISAVNLNTIRHCICPEELQMVKRGLNL